jgi:hypothetical protein
MLRPHRASVGGRPRDPRRVKCLLNTAGHRQRVQEGDPDFGCPRCPSARQALQKPLGRSYTAGSVEGLLAIYVQADPPEEALRTNWLPAPQGADFSIYMRSYWPKVEITDGSWTPPAVQRVG